MVLPKVPSPPPPNLTAPAANPKLYKAAALVSIQSSKSVEVISRSAPGTSSE